MGAEIPSNQAKKDCCKLLGTWSQCSGRLALTQPVSLSPALPMAPLPEKGKQQTDSSCSAASSRQPQESAGAQTILFLTQHLLLMPLGKRDAASAPNSPAELLTCWLTHRSCQHPPAACQDRPAPKVSTGNALSHKHSFYYG